MIKRKLMTSLLVTVMIAMSLSPCVMADETEVIEPSDEITEEIDGESVTEETEQEESEEIEVEEDEVIIPEEEIEEETSEEEASEAETEVTEEAESEEMTFEEAEFYDIVEVEVEEDPVIIDDGISNDELAEQYIMQEMEPGRQAYYSYDYLANLTETEVTIYNGILPGVQAVAAGDASSTILS